jgi:hypothetical protein
MNGISHRIRFLDIRTRRSYTDYTLDLVLANHPRASDKGFWVFFEILEERDFLEGRR